MQIIQQTALPAQQITLNNGNVLDLSRPQVMGILNVTPDSFSDGGKHNSLDTALAQCERMLAAGASIIDVGGESTRPQASSVSPAEEESRVLPVVAAIAQRFDVAISVDTSTPSLMQQAVAAGAHIWNDVRALQRQGAAAMAAKLAIPVMLMHSRGEPDTMMQLTTYDDVVTDVMTELTQRVATAVQAGVQRENLILDVGFGFAKNTQQNLQLLKSLSQFHALGLPLMIGLSRKRMLADVLAQAGLENDINSRIPAGLAAALLAVQQGVSIIRTHDVAQTMQALSVQQALQQV